MRRRDFFRVASSALITNALMAPGRLVFPDETDGDLVLLGTAGGPLLHPARSSPANALLLGDRTVLIDCGYGVAKQMVKAGISLTSLSHIFITHNHSDHYADVVMLPYLAWIRGLESEVHVYGPPPISQIVAAGLEMHSFDIETRMTDEGFPDLRGLMKVHEFQEDGLVLQDATFSVSAARNNHPPIEHSFAFRFDTARRSIVFSGDTTYSEDVVELARDADLLIHEILYTPALEAILRLVPTADELREHLLASHTPLEEVGRVAAAANVDTLVLSHVAPSFVTDEDTSGIVRVVGRSFSGKIIVGHDLLRL